MAGLASVLSIIMLAATGIAFVAREAFRSGHPWAYRVCSTVPIVCDHPEWMAFATIAVGIVYFVLRARDEE